MIVVAIIALLAAIALPGLQRARKRSQASSIKNDLRLIDAAVSQYAIETARKSGDAVFVDDWTEYVKAGTFLFDTGEDLFGRDFGDQLVDRIPAVPQATYDNLSDVADAAFWAPYLRATVPQPVTTANKKPKKKRKTS